MDYFQSQARLMGATGANWPPELLTAERLAFEEYMRGHCWHLEAQWNPVLGGYIAPGEDDTTVTAGGLLMRRMWAAWRDRAALAYRGVSHED